MKKILSIVIAIILVLGMSACELIDESDSMKDVSDLQEYLLVGNSDNYYVEVYGGKREFPLLIDGAVGKVKPYLKIKVLAKGGDTTGDYKYHIGVNEKAFDGTLSREVASGCYSVSIDAKDIADEYALTIEHNNKKEIITVKSCKASNMITFAEARKIAETELHDEILKLAENDNKYEMYIKFIEGAVGTKEFFWYVAYIDDGKVIACLIDPVSKKVVAKK